MRILSYNVNGLRAALSKGFIYWLKTDPADIICLQEIKATKENIDHMMIEEYAHRVSVSAEIMTSSAASLRFWEH